MAESKRNQLKDAMSKLLRRRDYFTIFELQREAKVAYTTAERFVLSLAARGYLRLLPFSDVPIINRFGRESRRWAINSQ